MKKILYIFGIVVLSTLSLSSCTEEEIVPATEHNGGGHPSDPK